MKERAYIEQQWARDKYKVMMHSQKHYNLIREELKKDISLESLHSLIDEAKDETPTKGSILNTFDHLWGYFKNICSEIEREQYKTLRSSFSQDDAQTHELLQFVRALTNKYDIAYLKQSTLLDV